MKLFEVGGCVRDELLGMPSKDIDFAVEAPSFMAMREEMIRRGFSIFQESPQFLTIRAKFPNQRLVADFVLCRKESGFSNGRHPDHVEPGTIYDDLARRDFTINAIAKCVESGTIIDPHNGVQDLKNKQLRAVGNAQERFSEDALRCLRALRFSITKDLEIHPEVWRAFDLPELPSLLSSVSVERKREELGKAFAADSLRAMRLLMGLSPALQEAIFADGNLWLKPTLGGKS
jgi:tRNA nucleotidyltransferase (CCA-adding enzyme)